MLDRCLGFIQTVQHICKWDDLIITMSDFPISFYANRKKLLSTAYICYLVEKATLSS